MAGRIDLHIHTTHSDGINSPEEVLEIVRKKRLAAFAICDHDSIGGYMELAGIIKKDDPELVPGVELSAGQGGEDIHILGYYFDSRSEVLREALERFRNNRNRRGTLMLKELKKLGIDIPMELVQKIAGSSAIGRPHIADAMFKTGAIKNYEIAFRKYIGIGGPAYVPKVNMNPKETIALIHEAGGLAFLAHPGVANAGRFIDEFSGYDLDGIEVYHPLHNNRQKKHYAEKAERKSLLMSGGSDCHGRHGHYGQIGSEPVPYEFLGLMKRKLKQRGIN